MHVRYRHNLMSFWEAETFFAPQDFIIVGSGFLGLWTAYELKLAFPKATITILERGIVPTGASTRNAGFACFGSPTEMMSDLQAMGADEVWKLVEMRFKGIEKIRTILGDAAIDFDGSGGFECFETSKHNLDEIKQQIIFLNKDLKSITKTNETFSWCNEKLPRQGLSGFDAMIETKLEGGLHSGKLAMNLLHKVRQLGVQVLNGIEVKSWHQNGEHLNIETDTHTFVTKRLVLATNAFTPELCDEVNTTPGRGQVIVTDPIEGLKLNGTFHFDEGFYYFRNVGKRVLLGGARNQDFLGETTTQLQISETIQQALEAFLQRHILQGTAYKIAYKWSGIMSFTRDKKPLIKQVSPNVHAVNSCNGMGVALSPIMAERIVDLYR